MDNGLGPLNVLYPRVLETSLYVPSKRVPVPQPKVDLPDGSSRVGSSSGILERVVSSENETHDFMAFEAIKKLGIDSSTAVIVAGNTHIEGHLPCVASSYQTELGTPCLDVILNSEDDVANVKEVLRTALRLNSGGGAVLVSNNEKSFFSPDAHNEEREHIKGYVNFSYEGSLAKKIARELGLCLEFSFDIITGCASTNYALHLAENLFNLRKQKVAVVSVDRMTRIVNPKDDKAIHLFGDMSSGVLIGSSIWKNFIRNGIYSDGSLRHLIETEIIDGKSYFKQEHRKVYTDAVRLIREFTDRGFEEKQNHEMISGSPGKFFVICHQGNPSMIRKALGDNNKIDGYVVASARTGNCASTSVVQGLDALIKGGLYFDGKELNPDAKGDQLVLQRGDYVLLFGMGAGFSYAYNLLKF